LLDIVHPYSALNIGFFLQLESGVKEKCGLAAAPIQPKPKTKYLIETYFKHNV